MHLNCLRPPAVAMVWLEGFRCAFLVQIWFQEDFRNFWDSCPWEEDLDYAKKVNLASLNGIYQQKPAQ